MYTKSNNNKQNMKTAGQRRCLKISFENKVRINEYLKPANTNLPE